MQASNIPVKFPVPFASSAGAGFIRSIPQNPTGTPGQASLTVGFPPENFNAVAAGGTPPFGQDFNGLLNQITAWNQWVSAGGGVPIFDSAFSTAIGGYPQGAFLQANGNPGHFWISLVDNNTVNPDGGFSLNWLPFPNSLTASRTFFVNGSTGNDSWNGTSATFVSGTTGPFATLQRAANEVPKYNLNGFNITINVANGTYSISTPIAWQPVNGSGQILITGNTGSPGSVIVACSSGSAMNFSSGNWVLDGFQITAPTANSGAGDPGNGISVNGAGATVIVRDVNFGACANAHMEAALGGQFGIYGIVQILSGGNAAFHLVVSSNGAAGFNSLVPPVLNVLGAVTFSSSFVDANVLSQVNGWYSGGGTGWVNVTGKRYSAESNSIINTNGGGAGAFPGTIGGTTATGGQYLP